MCDIATQRAAKDRVSPSPTLILAELRAAPLTHSLTHSPQPRSSTHRHSFTRKTHFSQLKFTPAAQAQAQSRPDPAPAPAPAPNPKPAPNLNPEPPIKTPAQLHVAHPHPPAAASASARQAPRRGGSPRARSTAAPAGPALPCRSPGCCRRLGPPLCGEGRPTAPPGPGGTRK